MSKDSISISTTEQTVKEYLINYQYLIKITQICDLFNQLDVNPVNAENSDQSNLHLNIKLAHKIAPDATIIKYLSTKVLKQLSIVL